MKKNRNIIIITLIIIILFIAVGYSEFATQLALNGTSEILGEWNVRITNVEAIEVSNGCDAGTPEYTDTNVTFDAKLLKPGDTITYRITIQNAGTINAKLGYATFKPQDDGSPAIVFSAEMPSKELPAGEETAFTLTVIYKDDIEEVPDIKTKMITGVVVYVQE